jgi:hypothetical protein
MRIATASSLVKPATQKRVQKALAMGTPVTVAPAKPAEIPAVLSYFESPHGAALLAASPGIKLDSVGRPVADHAINQARQSVPPSAAASFTPEIGLALGTVAGATLGTLLGLARAAGPSAATGYLVTIALAAAVGGGTIGGVIGGAIGLGMAGGTSAGPVRFPPLKMTS